MDDSDEGLIETLVQGVWVFGRLGGEIIYDAMRFLPDGQISGGRNANETSWRVREKKLEILNPDGDVTTRFESYDRVGGRVIAATGPFIGNVAQRVIHVIHLSSPTPTPACSGMTDVECQTLKNEEMRSDKQCAVLVRAHRASSKFYDLLKKLSLNSNYDVFAAVDVSNGPVAAPGFVRLEHSVKSCQFLGLKTNFHNPLWKCGDYVFYTIYYQIPNYLFYILIEYDVEISPEGGLFLQDFVKTITNSGEPLDFVAPNFGVASENWHWATAAAAVYPLAYASFFPFVCLSDRAIRYLFGERRLEAARDPTDDEVIHCEAFVPDCPNGCRNFSLCVPGRH